MSKARTRRTQRTHRGAQHGGDVQEEFLAACTSGNAETVARLLHEVDPGAWNQACLDRAIHNGHTEVVRILLQDPRVDPSVRDQSAIRDACRLGNTELVRLLLHHPRVDPSAKEQEAIRNACVHNHFGVVRLLLSDPRVDPSARGQAAFRTVMLSSNSNKILWLLLQDPRVNPRMTPEKAKILRTIPSKVLDALRKQAVYTHQDSAQFLVSLDHLLDKTLVKARASTLRSLRMTEGLGDLPSNLHTHVGHIVSGKVGPNAQSQLTQLKGNYFGPMRRTRKQS